MNPLRTIRILTRAQRFFGLIEKGSKDWDQRKAKGDDMSKSLFKSKTFWINVLSAGLELTQVLPIPPGYLLIATNVINVGLRLLTTEPVHLVAPK